MIQPQETKFRPEVTPTAWQMPDTVPPRQWLYGNHLCRKIVSGTVSPGGVGKSSLAVVDALSLVTGRKLLHHWCHKREGVRVWFWCGEDPLEELNRRFWAACRHYEVTSDKIGGRLFVDSGREQPIKIATMGADNLAVAMPVKDALIRQMREWQIDVLYIDPFITCHTVPENSNEAINVVIDAWRDIADKTNAAIELIHHANKAGNGDKIGDGRGASAFGDGIRGGRVLAPLSVENGEGWGLDATETSRITVVRNGAKPNMQPRGGGMSYFRMESVKLDNGTVEYPEGDSIGVATPWTPPNAFEGVTLNDLAKVQEAIGARVIPPAAAATNHDWAGHLVAEVMGLDVGEASSSAKTRTTEQNRDRKRVSELLAAWIKNGALRHDTIRSERDGRDVKVIVVGEPAAGIPEAHCDNNATALPHSDCGTTAELRNE